MTRHLFILSILLLAPAAAQAQTPARPVLARWVDLQNATLNLRYRVIVDSTGTTTTNQLQQRVSMRGRLKADAAGRVALNFGLFTGARFTSGWDNTPAGISDTQKNLAFKQLFVAVQPMSGIEGQAGGIYVIRGESTEITTYDEDGYLMGERLSLRRPKNLFFDEISVTNAHLTSDASKVGVHRRFNFIDEPNYRQFLVDKKIGKRAGISADFTTAAGARTVRQALTLRTPEARYVDSLLFEQYARTNRRRDYGFALSVEKAVTKKLTLSGGYAMIDPNVGGLNADRFNIGKRVFVTTTYVFSPEFTASYYITTAIGEKARLPLRTMSNLAFNYNALPGLRRTGWF